MREQRVLLKLEPGWPEPGWPHAKGHMAHGTGILWGQLAAA